MYKCTGTIENNIFSNNMEDYRSLSGLYECDGDIHNNTFINNNVDRCTGSIKNCIFWRDESLSGPIKFIKSSDDPEYCCIYEWTEGGTGNISDDPLFDSLESGDYHLTGDSPCIDVGTNTDINDDIDGNVRPYGAEFDMGADEWTPDWEPPQFDGIFRITEMDQALLIDINEASDASTPITYNIYISEKIYGQDFTAPYKSTDKTSVVLSGLENGRKYYFIVRAKDAYNNETENFNQLSAIPGDNLVNNSIYNFDFEQPPVNIGSQPEISPDGRNQGR